ncbi:hypothetical protein RchiOBHm_Chr2g0110241 [Rosa chinensis]|uniref:Uncharacterized protein n=1 Tax=Rosa chinensis TaxID=74649 RepID=A0A2P6RPR7_ROSCH|nr:hypothetical protein RchiOBHm_Chr2g0110241 [Rosa chinensis]
MRECRVLVRIEMGRDLEGSDLMRFLMWSRPRSQTQCIVASVKVLWLTSWWWDFRMERKVKCEVKGRQWFLIFGNENRNFERF